MKAKSKLQRLPDFDQVILQIRGRNVILDIDLALIYQVPTKRLNEQVKRNIERFPPDFVFQLNQSEKLEVVANCDHLKRLKFSPSLPFAFTEHGAMMAANVLRSQRAVAMSIFVVRAFNKMRELLVNNKALADKFAELEKKLTGRLDQHEQAILHLLEELKKLATFPNPPERERREIGFHVKGSLKNSATRISQKL